MKDLILREYKVVELVPDSLSEEFMNWVSSAHRDENGPFVSSFDGLHYLCLESASECELPQAIECELEQIKNAVGYYLPLNNPDRVWVVRVDEANRSFWAGSGVWINPAKPAKRPKN